MEWGIIYFIHNFEVGQDSIILYLSLKMINPDSILSILLKYVIKISVICVYRGACVRAWINL